MDGRRHLRLTDMRARRPRSRWRRRWIRGRIVLWITRRGNSGTCGGPRLGARRAPDHLPGRYDDGDTGRGSRAGPRFVGAHSAIADFFLEVTYALYTPR